MIETDDKYILVGQTPVPCRDLLEWGRWLEDGADRIVKQETVLGLCWVSTVFLGLDHNFLRSGRPVLFETMAFWRGEGGEEQDRCCTWPEAEAMHERMIAYVTSPRAVLAYIWRTLCKSCEEAKKDWVKGWRELRGLPARKRSGDPLWDQAFGSMERLKKLQDEKEDRDWDTYG